MNNNFLSRVRRFGNDFRECRSHECKSLPYSLTSDNKNRYSRQRIFHIIFNTILYVMNTQIRSFCHRRHGRSSQNSDVTTVDLWHHASARYWYCDVVFVDCHCTRKLMQRRSSLVNSSHEYIPPPGFDHLAWKKIYFLLVVERQGPIYPSSSIPLFLMC